MVGAGNSLLEAGFVALRGGDWEAARGVFAEACAAEESGPALLGLAESSWWLGDVPTALDLWERAYAALRRLDADAEAIGVAVNLSLLYNANFGNVAASSGWAARAWRLAEELGVPVLSGWALLARAATCPDPDQVVAWSREALRFATEAGDRDLELCALSSLGSALIDLGRTREGSELLDEAMAAALGGEAESLDSVVFTCCLLMQSCYRCADFPRVVQWGHAMQGWVARYGCPYVHATCRAHYGAVLAATGDWPRALDELQHAIALAGDALPAVRAEGHAYLADLRLAQGRPEEAEQLLVGFEDQPVTVPVLAAVRLAQGEPEAALVLTSQRRSVAGGRRLEDARLAEVAGEAHLACDDVTGAVREGSQLLEHGRRTGCELITARGARLLGRALLASGDLAEAEGHLAAACESFARLEMPLETARARLLLADALRHRDPARAGAEAEAAHTAFTDLGARRDADAAAAWLRRAGVTVGHRGPRGAELLTRRERELLELLAEGLSNPDIAERLYISRRTVEHHVASILSKLGLKNRVEAAARAATYLEVGSESE